MTPVQTANRILSIDRNPAIDGKRLKLLFLAHPFFPDRAPGCIRTWNIAKYLTRRGWDVTVVTPHPDLWKDPENSEEVAAALEREGVHRILTQHRWRCLDRTRLKHWETGVGWLFAGICRRAARQLGIDRGAGWIKPAEKACASLSPNDVDVILATAPPFAAFTLAKRLSDKLGKPYVLDYRDPWTGNPHRMRTHSRTIAKEKALLSAATQISIVSQSWAESVASRFGIAAKVQTVTNGYDLEELERIQPYHFGHFAIVYTGTFYPPKRVITPIMFALQKLKEDLKGQAQNVYFHYYGPHGNHIKKEGEVADVMDRIIIHGLVPRQQALSAIRGANVAVVITSVEEEVTREEQGIVTGKIFEAMGLGTPVLLISPLGSDAGRILEHAGQGRAFSGKQIDDITAFVADLRSGQVEKREKSTAYSWPAIAAGLDGILRQAIDSREIKAGERPL